MTTASNTLSMPTSTRSERLGASGILAILALIAVPACGVGSVGDGGGGEEEVESLLCMAELSVSGTLTPGEQPPDEEGCIPSGTWELSVELVDMADCQDVQYDGQYTYEVTGSPAEGGYVVTYLEDPDNPNVYLKVKGQGGACEGSFEHWSADGKTLLLLKPYEEDTVITGSGYFELYSESQL